ncbi:MAG: DUF4149 domain-containing protein [Microcystaceae cyanobacterium]
MLNDMSFAVKNTVNKYPWTLLVMLALGFWLSASLVIDFVMMPGMMATGMTRQAGFIDAGYLIFGIFNHLELFCASLVLTGCFIFAHHHYFTALQERFSLLFAGCLLAIALVYTYGLTPALSSLGFEMMTFNGSCQVASPLLLLHGVYWGLELLKLILGVTLLRWCYQQDHALDSKRVV